MRVSDFSTLWTPKLDSVGGSYNGQLSRLHRQALVHVADRDIFSPLKQSWAAAVTEHEFNGKSVTKDNFIKVYSSAHLHAFTKANILAAFRKTGIYPFNPLVITKAQMAPSTMDSINAADAMLIQLTSPVKKVMQLFRDQHVRQQSE